MQNIHNTLFPKRSDKQVAARAPGKLYIAGEYAVLQPNQPAIIMAVNQYLTVHIKPSHSDQLIFTSQLTGFNNFYVTNDLDYSENTDDQIYNWRYTLSAVQTVTEFIQDLGIKPRSYHLSISTDLISDQGLKFGFGSSGAVVVASITALLKYYGVEEINSLLIYKLAAIALTRLGSNGSFGDIAASAYGHWIYYQAVDRQWLAQELSTNISLVDLIKRDWKDLGIKYLPTVNQMTWLVGWTQSPASTDNFVSLLQERQADQPATYQQFLANARLTVDNLKNSIESLDIQSIKSGITNYSRLLEELATAYHLDIVTDELTTFIEDAKAFGFAAKSSGAGGGDCGIATGINDEDQVKQLQARWKKHGILPLNIKMAPASEENRYFN